MTDTVAMQTPTNVPRAAGTGVDPVLEKRSHYYICSECGQPVDARRLDQVLHHAGPDHVPLRADG